MSKEEWRWSGHIGKAGIIARSIVFGIIGFFLIRTALQADPDETKGLDGALAEVAQRPFGLYCWLSYQSGLWHTEYICLQNQGINELIPNKI